MFLSKIHIQNFKGYECFNLDLRNGLNIIVGDNGAKKSTILEAINLVLTGQLDGRYLTKDTLNNEFLFNKKTIEKYLNSIKSGGRIDPPHILIELFINDDEDEEKLVDFEGANNYTYNKAKGIYLRIALREELRTAYNELLSKKTDIKSLPLEYYDLELVRFSGTHLSRHSLPIKASLIDTTSSYADASDMIISRIIKTNLNDQEKLGARQLHRGLKDMVKGNPTYDAISNHIQDTDVTVELDPSSRNSWDSHLTVYHKGIPFTYIGKGQQTILKTNFSLTSKKSAEAGLILIEEPENHLSHIRLSELVNKIHESNKEKQIIISTHNSFVANKLDLGNLILLDDGNSLAFTNLELSTRNFFSKLPGYDTLRVLLCRKAILVEGDADELIVQRAYMDKNSGRLPIGDGIDVISVVNTYDRFLQIATPLKRKVALLVDVDTKIESRKVLKEKWSGADAKTKDFVGVFFEENDGYQGSLKEFNENTLEPLLLKYNGRELLGRIFEKDFENDDSILDYMRTNKTNCALKIFESAEKIKYPSYISEAIDFIS